MTSIELLKQDLDPELKLGTKMVVNWDMYIEMHKQEIIDAHNKGFEKSGEGWNGEYGLEDMNNISEEIKSEQYYQETFKKD
jgi:hypothetical protein